MPSESSIGKITSTEEINRFLAELDRSRQRFADTSVRERISLAQRCAEGVVDVAETWVDLACEAKAIAPGNPTRAEEIFVGPVATLRYLRLLAHSLRGIETKGIPQLPGKAYTGPDGRLRVPLLPTGVLYDRIAFLPFKVTAWMRDGVRRENLEEHLAVHYRAAAKTAARMPAKIVVVLGAGNVSAIPLTDTFTKMFHEGSVVLLKLSPVNDYLGPVFQRVMRPLIDSGYLRIAYGASETGAAAVNHPLVDEVHITGSIQSHDAIVWGPPGVERNQRKIANRPLLEKTVTSELGNVSPWVFIPGVYSARQLAFQAENVAASIVNNVSFNCVATKVLITWKQWPLRARFVDLVDDFLARTPKRFSYYPGAVERFRRFSGIEPPENSCGYLPWTLLRDVQPDESPHLLGEESFACVAAEIALDAPTPEDFLRKAVDFANERLAGTLCAAVTHPRGFRSRKANERLLQSCLGKLRYNAIAINHWPGLMYAMMSPPWGGLPGSTLADAQSGIGTVHNTFLLGGIEKSVLEGPVTFFPKPPWFPTHTRADRVAWSYFHLYRRPSWTNVVRLLIASV